MSAQTKNVLVPYDGSKESQHALLAALDLCKGSEPARVTALRVMPHSDFSSSTFEVAAQMAGMTLPDAKVREDVLRNYVETNRNELQEQISEFFESVPDNVTLGIEVGHGRPHEVIVDYAQENNITCIVMGRRGLGAVRSALGSVSSAVLRDTDLPVFVVK